jgi:hypothetical protein
MSRVPVDGLQCAVGELVGMIVTVHVPHTRARDEFNTALTSFEYAKNATVYPALPDAKRHFKVLAAPDVHAHIVSTQLIEIILKVRTKVRRRGEKTRNARTRDIEKSPPAIVGDGS